MKKISVISNCVKLRRKKHFSCQRVGGLSKISPPFSSISITKKSPLNHLQANLQAITALSLSLQLFRACGQQETVLEVNQQTSNDEINEQEDFQDYLQQQPAPIIAQIETPLFGSISVIENPFVENHCIFCGKALPARAPGTKGRPQVSHPECGQLSRSLDFFVNSLEKISMTPDAIRRLRSRLFQAANDLQIPRDAKGRFLTSKVSHG